MQDLEIINEQQNQVEADAAAHYPEKKIVQKKVEGLLVDCKKLINDAKGIQKELEKVRDGHPRDVGKGMEPIGNKLVDLAKRIFGLSEKLEPLGKQILKNIEDLRVKMKFPPKLKAKTDIQGKRLENSGGKLQSIGRNVGVLGDKLNSIGGRVEKDIGPKLKDYGGKLKDSGEKIKDKGGPVAEVGIKIQNCEPIEGDPEADKLNAKDMDDMQKALGEIGKDLEAILKVNFS